MNKRFPRYPDDADYQTNAPSYYDDLARKQKLIEMLAKKIWEYDERLNNRLDELNTVLSDYLDQWDDRIENLDEEVSDIFIEWLNDGTLEKIINHDVLGNKADKSFVDSEIERLEQEDENITEQLTHNKNLVDDLVVNVKDFGAIGDGLTVEDESINQAIQHLKQRGGGTLYFPKGVYLTDFTFYFDFDVTVMGAGHSKTKIKVKDDSKLFHNPGRKGAGYTDHGKGDVLFRDYHAVFFFYDCDFTVQGLHMDGNGYKQNVLVDGVERNYAHQSFNSENFYHLGIACRHIHKLNPVIKIKENNIENFTWNTITLGGTNTSKLEKSQVTIHDNIIGASPNDSISLHNLSNIKLFNNTFLNALGHNLHLYYMLENVNVYDNSFIIDEIKPFKPDTLETARIKNQPITVGHEAYQENTIKNVEIKNNYMINTLLDYQDKTNNGISLLSTLENVTVKDNSIINFYGGIFSAGIVNKTLVISDNNILNYGYGGIMLRPVKADGTLFPIPETIDKLNVNNQIRDNVITSNPNFEPKTRDFSMLNYGYNNTNNPKVNEYTVTLDTNDFDNDFTYPNNNFFKLTDLSLKQQEATIYNFVREFPASLERVIEANSSYTWNLHSGAFNPNNKPAVFGGPRFQLPMGIQYSLSVNEGSILSINIHNSTSEPITLNGDWLFKVLTSRKSI